MIYRGEVLNNGQECFVVHGISSSPNVTLIINAELIISDVSMSREQAAELGRHLIEAAKAVKSRVANAKD